jgi:hypothetical protein
MAQGVEHSPNTCEVLSSNFSTIKKKKFAYDERENHILMFSDPGNIIQEENKVKSVNSSCQNQRPGLAIFVSHTSDAQLILLLTASRKVTERA